MVNDPYGDLLTRIRNGYLAGKRRVRLPHSIAKEKLAKTLLRAGYLKKVATIKKEHKLLELTLSYQGKEPAFSHLKRVSKPGQRVYLKVKQIHSVRSGLGVVIVSTSAGLMTGREARQKSLGGEIICQVW